MLLKSYEYIGGQFLNPTKKIIDFGSTKQDKIKQINI